MSDTPIAENHDDFLAKILSLIEEGHTEQAAEEIVQLKKLQQLEILPQLATQVGALKLRFDLTVIITFIAARELISSRSTELEFAVAHRLVNVFECAAELASDKALASALSTARDRALMLTEPRNYGRRLQNSSAIERAHVSAVKKARDRDMSVLLTALGSVIELLIFNFAPAINVPEFITERVLVDYEQTLLRTLEACVYLQQQQPSGIVETISQVLQRLLDGKLRYITLEGITAITPDTLSSNIAPYLRAFNDFLRIHYQIIGSEFQEMHIAQINGEVPQIEFAGVGDTLRAVIELLKIEPAQKLTDDYRGAASAYVDRHAPQLSAHERASFVVQMADAMKRLKTSDVRLRLGWHESLPK